MDFQDIDFNNVRFSDWYPQTKEYFYRGVFFRYAELLKEGKLTEAQKLYDNRIEEALIHGATDVRVFAHRALAAIVPERSLELHKKLLESGGIASIYGAFGVPDAPVFTTLIPALSSPDPGFTALAAVGLRKLDAPPPIQLPIAKE